MGTREETGRAILSTFTQDETAVLFFCQCANCRVTPQVTLVLISDVSTLEWLPMFPAEPGSYF